jgi:SH3-like domain-containing protein
MTVRRVIREAGACGMPAVRRQKRPVLIAGLLLACALLAAPGNAAAQVGRATGLPLPRFVSLSADEVNLRFGPGEDHPIAWILTRDGLPVEIVEEFDTWRQVRLHDGETGWIHSSLLSSRRTILVTGEIRALRQSPDPEARIVLRAEPGVIGDLLDCNEGWCRIEIAGRRGWLPRDHFWGTLPNETLR